MKKLGDILGLLAGVLVGASILYLITTFTYAVIVWGWSGAGG